MIRTALIVEDLPDASVWLSETLAQAFAGVQISCAATIEDALSQLGQQTFDLALIDLHLPDGSGLSIIEHINAHHGSTLSIVASIYDDDEHIFPAIQNGAQGYLLKERPREELVKELQGIVAGRPPLSPAIARFARSIFRTSS